MDVIPLHGPVEVKEEHTVHGLVRKLARDVQANPSQLQLVERCCSLYAEQGVVACGLGLPLHAACAACEDCWAPFSQRHHPRWGEGAVSTPWVGWKYSSHEVCAVGINQNSYGGLGALWWIINGAIGDLEAGHRGRRYFHLHAGAYLAAIHAALGGVPAADAEQVLDPYCVAEAWRTCAFVEAVKCAPAGNRSTPGKEMWANCPPLYLRAELTILAPRILVAIGHKTWEAVTSVVPIKRTESSRAFRRGTGSLGGRSIDAFFVNHPSYGNWRASLPSLLASLAHRPPGG